MVAARGAISGAAASGAAAALFGRSMLANSSDTTTTMPVTRTPRRTTVMRRANRSVMRFVRRTLYRETARSPPRNGAARGSRVSGMGRSGERRETRDQSLLSARLNSAISGTGVMPGLFALPLASFRHLSVYGAMLSIGSRRVPDGPPVASSGNGIQFRNLLGTD